jgi:hypothetical protein
MEQQKITWCFTPKACTSWGTSMKQTHLAPQKIPKEGYDFIYVGTLMEFCVFAFFSFAFWLTMIMINSSN